MRSSRFRMILFALAATSLFGQGYKATIVGRVTDPSGAAAAGVKVTATNTATNIAVSATTNDAGDYVIPQLIPGRYQVTAEAPGFKQFVRSGITLEVDATVRVDASLEVGAVKEQVVVSAEAGVVNTETSSLGEVISNREITDMPLDGRNYLTLALLAPGVVQSTTSNPYNINGARQDHVDFLMDGVTNMNRRGNNPVGNPSIDAIQEYKIITNSFSAEFGRLGAGVISVALRSGGNQLHGSFYDFLRNDMFDARGFFDNSVPNLRRNQFGTVVSGPVIRNRTFFLFNYEGSRIRSQQTVISRIPTLDERAGIFSAAIRDPITRLPYPGNRLPASAFSPVALNILGYVPDPNRVGPNNYYSALGSRTGNNNYIVKIDHMLRPADQFSVRFLRNGGDLYNPYRNNATNLPGFGANRITRQQFWSAVENHTFSPTFVNEFRAGYVRDDYQEVSENAGKNLGAKAGIQGVQPGFGLTNIVIAGYAQIGDPTFLPDLWTDNEYMISDTLSKVHGGHNMRFGGEYQRSQHFNTNNALLNAQLTFQGQLSANSFADFLLGYPTASQRQLGELKTYIFGNYYGAFFQDDWKVTPTLTLNLGVRYDFNQPPIEKYGRWANFLPSLGRVVKSGDAGYPESVMQSHHHYFSPRFGFAWRPFGGTRTVVRGGYGVFYAFDLQQTMYSLLGRVYPFSWTEGYQSTATSLLTIADPFPQARLTVIQGATTPSGWEYKNPTPYNQQWNVTISHEIWAQVGADFSYVGTKATHDSVTVNMNQPFRTPQGTFYLFPNFSQINYQTLGSNANYNALQIAAHRRFRRGLTFRSNFTYSKAMDYDTPQDPRNLGVERGLTVFTRKFVWTSDFAWQIPWMRRNRILGNWQLNGILQCATGRPFTPTVSGANALVGQAVRPDRLRPGTVPNPTIERWFDPTAFVPVLLSDFRFGNSGRDILIGPGYTNLDASLFKDFPMPWEGHRVQVRGEFFNLANIARFGQPIAAVNVPNSATITAAGPGRQIQLALKYYF